MAIELLLRPAGDSGVAEALMPMLMTQQIENLDSLPEKISPDVWLTATTIEYARHLRDYPPDILKAACDAHVTGGSQFFPKVYEITKHANAALELRKRQQWRIDQLIRTANKPSEIPAFVKEPEEWRLRASIWRGWKDRVDGGSFLSPVLWRSAQDSERRLAHIENREPAEWAVVAETLLPPRPRAVGISRQRGDGIIIDQPPDDEPPLPDEIPEAMELE